MGFSALAGGGAAVEIAPPGTMTAATIDENRFQEGFASRGSRV